MTEEQLKHPVALVGHMDLRFNAGFQDTDTPCPHITWMGVITFGDDVYAITYEPTAPPKVDGDSFEFEEIWRILDLSDVVVVGGVATACGGVGLMWGTDKGEGNPTGGRAAGRVLFVDPNGPFDKTLTDRNVHWSGVFSEDKTEVAGPFRID